MSFVHIKIELPIPEVNTQQHDVYSAYAKTASFTVLTYEGEEISIHNLHPNSCQKCGEYLEWEHDPNGTIQSVTVCDFPEGTTYTSTINVPSGRIVFADSLFHVFPELHEHDDLDYNSAVGRKEYARRLPEHHHRRTCYSNHLR